MQKFTTLDDVKVENKVVLLRLDLNVPMKDGKITSNERIVRSLVTIKELVEKKAKVVIMSHLGRPKGEGFEAEFSLKPVAVEVAKTLNQDVAFVNECIGQSVKDAISKLNGGDILMLENLRFHKEEEKNNPEFVKELASLGDIYVSDAFSTAHRAHASTEGLAHVMEHSAGRLMQAEVEALESALNNPEKPVVAIVGGAKISTKLDVFHNLVEKVDTIIIGGGMANTFLHALGVDVQKSLCEKDMKNECLQIIDEAKLAGCTIALPVDAQMALEPSSKEIIMQSNKEIPVDFEIFDVGTKSVENFKKILDTAKTVIWNGPIGMFEVKPYDNGTSELAKHAAKLTKEGKLKSIAGGGDTVSALQNAGVYDDFTYISTAGGAFLEWMEGKVLPGVKVLEK